MYDMRPDRRRGRNYSGIVLIRDVRRIDAGTFPLWRLINAQSRAAGS